MSGTFARRWADLKPRRRRQLLVGQHRLIPTQRVHCEQDVLEIWPAIGALFLKTTAIVLGSEWHSRLSARQPAAKRRFVNSQGREPLVR
jgi:hypothetical protein